MHKYQTFNRTIEELKPQEIAIAKGIDTSFNRTIEELKPTSTLALWFLRKSFNRTIEELKRIISKLTFKR